MTVGIYIITNPNNHTYIGSSKNIERRFKQYKALSCKTQKAIYASLVKYGYDNHTFQIICVCPEDKLLWHEQYYVDNFQPELNIAKIVGRPDIKSGSEHYKWKGGICSNKKAYNKQYKQTEEYKTKQKAYREIDKNKTKKNKHNKAYMKEYSKSDEYKTRRKIYMKQYQQNEEYKLYQKAYREKKKAEKTSGLIPA